MKIMILFLFLGISLCYAHNSYSQTTRLTLDLKNKTIKEIFSEIEKSSEYIFLYHDESLDVKRKFTLTVSNQPIDKVLDDLFKHTGMLYFISDRQVFISKSKESLERLKQQQEPQQQKPVEKISATGTVSDEKGELLPGVSIVLKSSLKSDRPVANLTNAEGKYIFTGLEQGDRLIFTFIGMEPLEVVIKQGQTLYNVTMKYSESQLKEVVVETGIFQRDKVSFTGATTSYTGSELRVIGNQNLLESLKVMDPSFVMIDNYEMGSNPNSVSTIELRGQGSATINAITDEFSSDPNQPLFVINGVEASFSRVKDLDINRIESITILKDAGSTAIYGSKGANGVVVIETVKPRPGELKLYYNGDYGLQMPDLSVYNLMNSAEKLEFERLAGKYNTSTSNDQNAAYQKALTGLYNYRLAEVQRGVDTYWLNEPVQTAFTHGHSLRVSGGDQSLSFDVGGKFKIQKGVMKKSGRDTWGGDIGITYRSGKVIVSNTLDTFGYTAKESPYGYFSEWAQASPYFRKTNAEGGIDKFLQYRDEGAFYEQLSSIATNIANPLYNAQLNSKDQTSGLSLINSFNIQYHLNDFFRFKTGINLSATRTKVIRFTPPEHTKYYDKSAYYQGEYYGKDSKSDSYHGYADISYARLINTMHSFTLLARGEFMQAKSDYTSLEAVGFPYGSRGAPNLAHSYKEESSPGYYLSDRRSAGFAGAFNYDCDRRYLFDFSYRIDGATTFGSNELYKSFWSTGIGWNIDREAFFKGSKWLDQLKLRATTGVSGNQNQGSTVSQTVYQLYLTGNIFGQGIYISDFANPDLPWQTAKDYGVGLDFRTRKGRVSLSLDYYHSKTDPNIIFVPQVPSVGISTYPMALGNLTKKGVEFVLSVYPVYNLKDRVMWGIRVTGLNSKSTYGGLGELLNMFNEQQRKDNTLTQYRDGYSPSDIWAVRSYGIDPADGTEIFIKKNGELTKEYNADEMVVVGSERPDLIGVLSTSFRYKNFSVNMAFRYSFGGDIYNMALYDKVENITKEALQYNQDKRALYDRWKNIGDIANYKSISVVLTTSAKTSRFVQKNNYLNAESISLSYELNDNEWIKRNLSVRSMRITGYLNDIFRLETSRTERGINYPFARSASIGLNLSF
jgi:TonB-linked SusC/RagA family outer membrane protein